ncbi:MAG: hypothetical protein QGH94_20965 [Phycisphaerae bacterium]|jgi:peptidoglycan/LPS O-acetylase OafA/YrhL|nr:hypothetical protein [Phycisphaerae bacterium]
MNEMTLAVLVAFYLFLAVRWDLVRRKLPFLVGVGAVAFIMLTSLFGLGTGTRSVMVVFITLGMIAAFAAGIATCCGMELPIDKPAAGAEEPPAEQE